jgi:hypothetical protein
MPRVSIKDHLLDAEGRDEEPDSEQPGVVARDKIVGPLPGDQGSGPTICQFFRF